MFIVEFNSNDSTSVFLLVISEVQNLCEVQERERGKHPCEEHFTGIETQKALCSHAIKESRNAYAMIIDAIIMLISMFSPVTCQLADRAFSRHGQLEET